MRVLGIIPARGGSKGIPRKNMQLLNGKPLIAYTVESALKAKRLARVILSTEDDEIAETGRNLGVDVPFMRPPELAGDETPTFPVVLHAIDQMEKAGESFDAVCLLQPTNPLRRSEDIDACINLLESTGADSVISFVKVPHQYNPKWVYWRNEFGEMALSSGESSPISRRQDLPDAFHRDGSIYLTRVEVVRIGSLYGSRIGSYLIDPDRSINVDEPDDWEIAEKCLSLQRDGEKSMLLRSTMSLS